MLRLPAVNETLGSYRILRSLGEGGMGAVYEVEHLQLGVHYALKDPAKRPTSLIDLPRLLSNECTPSGEAVSSPLVRKSKPSTSRHPRLISTLFITAALLLAALTVAFFFLSSDTTIDDDQLIEEAYAIPESVT